MGGSLARRGISPAGLRGSSRKGEGRPEPNASWVRTFEEAAADFSGVWAPQHSGRQSPGDSGFGRWLGAGGYERSQAWAPELWHTQMVRQGRWGAGRSQAERR